MKSDHSDPFKKYRGTKESRKKLLTKLFTKRKDSVLIANDKTRYTLQPGKDRDGRPGTLLGSGAHGSVKKVKDEKGNELAVKKPLRPRLNKKFAKLNADERRAEQERRAEIVSLERELQFLERLDDGRTPRLIVTDDNAYLIQAIVKGKPLCTAGEGCVVDLIREANGDAKNLPVLLVKLTAMALRVVALIESLHTKQILHRDLFHANIMFDFDTFEGRIIDFGRAIFFDEHDVKQHELRREISHSTLEHLKLSDYEMFFQGFSYGMKESGFSEYLKSFLDLMKNLHDEFNASRTESKDAKSPQEVVQFVKVRLKEFIDEICDKNRLKCSAVLSQKQPKPAALAPKLSVAESKASATHENNVNAVPPVKTYGDYFKEAWQAFSSFCKEQWRKFCEACSGCLPSRAEDDIQVSKVQVATVKSLKSVSGRAGSSYRGPLKPLCGTGAQPVGTVPVVQHGWEVGESKQEQQPQAAIRVTSSLVAPEFSPSSKIGGS